MFTTSSKEDATFGLGWRVNGNATMTPTFGTLASRKPTVTLAGPER